MPPSRRFPAEKRLQSPLLPVVACALVDRDGRVLLAQRPEGKVMAGLWEFPGGKIAQGETPEEALIRELREETGIETESSCLAPFSFVSYGDLDGHRLVLLYICRKWRGFLRPCEGQSFVWARPREISGYPMPPANASLVAMLSDWL